MSGPPQLPPLPPGFGNDSSYPPHPRIPSGERGRGSSNPPPVPPLPPGALQREQQERARYNRSPQPPPLPFPLASTSTSFSASTSGFRPGQIIAPPTPQPQPYLTTSRVPSIRAPSPSPSPHHGAFVASPPPIGHHSFPQPQIQHERPVSTASTAYLMPQSASYSNLGHSSRPHSIAVDHSMPDLSTAMSNASLGPPHPASHLYHSNSVRRASSSESNPAYHSQPRRESTTGPPSLNIPLPDMDSLHQSRDAAFATRDDRQQLAWAKQVLKFVERKFSDGSKISEPRLVRWTDEAIGVIRSRASGARPDPEALYLRGDLQASGAFPTYLNKDLKEAFNDFELSARLGWPSSWFRIGRDYELLNDFNRARDAYQRGVGAGDVGSIYRLGMANLLGQLDLAVNHAKAIAMLKDAADRANQDTPQPSYIYGMLLAGEFNHVDIPKHLLLPTPDPRNPRAPVTLESEARRRIERAAYLNFAPAQYKCGWSYEYAQLGCPFDPLLSVQYYSLASQGGEIEADMALSKWFLCGAEGCFEKNEALAFTFADKAARKGLASAEFALGYYYEVGVGTDKSVDTARKWYRKAAAHDNSDAKDRLKALEGPAPATLSRREHEAHIDDKLQRKHTQAKLFSDREGRAGAGASAGGSGGGGGGQRPGGSSGSSSGQAWGVGGNELNRSKTMRMVEETAGRRPRRGGANGVSEGSGMPVPSPGPAAAAAYQNASPGRVPQPQPQPQQNRIPSGPPAAQGKHGAGYSLSDVPVPVPGPEPSITHVPASSAHSAPAAAAATVPGPAPSSSSGSSGKVYSTFAEMGYTPQKVKKEECVIC